MNAVSLATELRSVAPSASAKTCARPNVDHVVRGRWTAPQTLSVLRELAGDDDFVVLSSTDQVLLHRLVLHAGEGHETWVGVPLLASQIGKSARTVRRSLSILRKAGMIESWVETTDRGRRNRYRILLAPAAGYRAEGANDGPRSEAVATSGTIHGAANGTTPPPTHLLSDRDHLIASSPTPPTPPPPTAPASLPRARETLSLVPEHTTTCDVHEAARRLLLERHALLCNADARFPAVTKPWLGLLMARLNQGYDVETLRDVIAGARVSPWNATPHRRTVEMLFGSASRIEALAKIGRAERSRKPRLPAPSQVVTASSWPPDAPSERLSAETMGRDLARLFPGWDAGAA